MSLLLRKFSWKIGELISISEILRGWSSLYESRPPLSLLIFSLSWVRIEGLNSGWSSAIIKSRTSSGMKWRSLLPARLSLLLSRRIISLYETGRTLRLILIPLYRLSWFEALSSSVLLSTTFRISTSFGPLLRLVVSLFSRRELSWTGLEPQTADFCFLGPLWMSWSALLRRSRATFQSLLLPQHNFLLCQEKTQRPGPYEIQWHLHDSISSIVTWMISMLSVLIDWSCTNSLVTAF